MQHKRVTLLFLGDPKLDRRIQSFASMFRGIGLEPTIYFTIPGDTSSKVTRELVQIPSRHATGPRLFLSHHSGLRKHLTEISRSDVIVACDLYSLRAAAQAKQRGLSSVLIYDARELYTGLPAVATRPFVRYVWKRWEESGMMEADFISITAPHDADAIFRVHSFLPRPILIRNIPLRSAAPVPDVQFLRDRGISQDDKVAVYVGGLQSDRGLNEAIEAIARLGPNVKLLLMGTGALDAELRRTASGPKDRVIFAGAVEQERVLPILAACDVGLSLIQSNSPSYELALPSKIFEYLHAGLPIVSTELRHVSELFDHQPYMHYVTSLESQELANAIARAIERKEQLSGIISEAAEQYSFDADFEKLKLLLSERLAERG